MKNVLITGINSGIGCHIALLLAEHGFRVIGTMRDRSTTPAEISQHPNIHIVEMHLDTEPEIENAYEKIRLNLGQEGLFALINNAGMVEPGPLASIPVANFKYVFQINVFGPLKLIQLSLDALRAYGKGSRIINMSSVSGLFASPFLGAYAGSKFALEGFSDSLRRELNLLGIHVVKLNPGSLKTGIWRKQLDKVQMHSSGLFEPYLLHANETILKMESESIPVQAIDDAVLHALLSESPRTSYLIHQKKFLFRLLTKYLPVNFVDRLIYQKLKKSSKHIRPF